MNARAAALLLVLSMLALGLGPAAAAPEDYKYRCQVTPSLVRHQNTPCDEPSQSDRSPRSASVSATRCALTDSFPPKEDATKEAGKRAVLGALKDPYSAVFDGVLYARVDCGGRLFHAACMVVNAKNAYGAYTGSDVFVFRANDEGGRLMTVPTLPTLRVGATLKEMEEHTQRLVEHGRKLDEQGDVVKACTDAKRMSR